MRAHHKKRPGNSQGSTKIEGPKCVSCEANGISCDRERPCGQCAKLKRACFYIDEEGLVCRTYTPQVCTSTSFNKLDVQESDDECVRCQETNADDRCAGRPCTNCVHAGGYCKFRHKSGYMEKYTTATHVIADEEKWNSKLKKDWQKFAWKHRKASKTGGNLPPKIATTPRAVVSATATLKDARNARGGDTRPISPANSAVLESPVQQDVQPGTFNTSLERLVYNQMFPYGHHTLSTPGERLQCGLEAIVRSFPHQHPSIPAPTVTGLLALSQSEGIAEANSLMLQLGESIETNLTVDYLGALLHLWSLNNGRNVVLGYLQGTADARILHSHDSRQNNAVTVWIQSDNAEQDGVAEMAHFSAMAPNHPEPDSDDSGEYSGKHDEDDVEDLD
jgi:hypothetical protein